MNRSDFGETGTAALSVTQSGGVVSAPFRGAEAVVAGLVTPGELRGSRFRRVFPDVYLPADAPLDLVNRSRAAYLLVAQRGGVLAGWSAAELLGAWFAPADAPAEVLVDFDLRPRPGLRVHRGRVQPDEVRERAGLRLTSPIRTAYDLGRWCEPDEAVIAIDGLAALGGFAPADLGELRRRNPGARGSRRLDAAIELADPRAESAIQTRLRLVLVRAGLPVPVVRHPVLDHGAALLGWLDLAYPDALLGVEYDGEGPGEGRRERDRRRDAAMAELGWRVLRVSSADVLATPERTVGQVRAALAERLGDRDAGRVGA